ncbi:MAG: pyridoxal-phosphate dependent enzyme [Pirellulaceae bacterium]
MQQETGAELVHPFDDPRVIAGQGTAAWELLDQVTGLDAILTPVGGGGLISGTCLATQSRSQQTNMVYGARTAGGRRCRPFKSGPARRLRASPDTVADGLRGESIGS